MAVWFDPEMTREASPTGERDRPAVDSDAAVQTCLTMKGLFGKPLAQIEPLERHWSA